MEQRQPSRFDIYILDDDAEIREALDLILSRAGYRTSCFGDGSSLMAVTRDKKPACILLDIILPDRSGLQVLKELRDHCDFTPVIILSGIKEIRVAVEALKMGAVDYIEKPFSGSDLPARVEAAIGHNHQSQSNRVFKIPANFPGQELLSQRELEVLEQCVVGATAKEVARLMGVSPRTVESHRASLLRKLDARNIAEVVRKVMQSDRAADNEDRVVRNCGNV